jgi:hypothetical protein
MKPNTPPVPCVPVYTAETAESLADISVNTTYGMPLSEKAAIRYLVKECGWRVAAPGVLQHGWRVKEVA